MPVLLIMPKIFLAMLCIHLPSSFLISNDPTHCDVHRSLVEMLCVLYGLNFWHMCSKHATRIADQVRKYPFHVWRYLKLKVYQHCALDLDIEHAALAVHAIEKMMVSCV